MSIIDKLFDSTSYVRAESVIDIILFLDPINFFDEIQSRLHDYRYNVEYGANSVLLNNIADTTLPKVLYPNTLEMAETSVEAEVLSARETILDIIFTSSTKEGDSVSSPVLGVKDRSTTILYKDNFTLTFIDTKQTSRYYVDRYEIRVCNIVKYDDRYICNVYRCNIIELMILLNKIPEFLASGTQEDELKFTAMLNIQCLPNEAFYLLLDFVEKDEEITLFMDEIQKVFFKLLKGRREINEFVDSVINVASRNFEFMLRLRKMRLT